MDWSHRWLYMYNTHFRGAYHSRKDLHDIISNRACLCLDWFPSILQYWLLWPGRWSDGNMSREFCPTGVCIVQRIALDLSLNKIIIGFDKRMEYQRRDNGRMSGQGLFSLIVYYSLNITIANGARPSHLVTPFPGSTWNCMAVSNPKSYSIYSSVGGICNEFIVYRHLVCSVDVFWRLERETLIMS